MTDLLKPLYPALYGWEVTYQAHDGRIVFCSCFREAWLRYFAYLQNELADSYLRTHRERLEGRALLRVAFSRFSWHLNPTALKAFFPAVALAGHEPHLIEGKWFFFKNDVTNPPELSESFWHMPYEKFQFEDKICEVCTGTVPNHYFCHRMYGSSFAQIYGAWIKAELVRQGHIDSSDDFNSTGKKLWKDAEDSVRLIVGVAKIGEKFVAETMLFKATASILRGHDVMHHFRAEWLGRQELDIFVPSLNLAIEYHGEQHFMPIDAWGGQEALEKTKQRDEEKKRKCQERGIMLIYFDYTMQMTESFIAARIEEALGIQLL